jgi:hypothetical protein
MSIVVPVLGGAYENSPVAGVVRLPALDARCNYAKLKHEPHNKLALITMIHILLPVLV